MEYCHVCHQIRTNTFQCIRRIKHQLSEKEGEAMEQGTRSGNNGDQKEIERFDLSYSDVNNIY